MDGVYFDAISRHLSAMRSRRETVKAAAMAGLGLGLAGLAPDAAEAKKKRKKRKKRCKGLGQGCTPGAKRKCCQTQDLICGKAAGDLSATICCKGVGTLCNDPEECCGVAACIVDPVLGGPKKCRPLLT